MQTLKIIFSFIKYSFKKETAYWANNWGNLVSTFMYTLTTIMFIEFIYSRWPTIGGYTKNQMFILAWVFQLLFFLWFMFETQNFIELVRTGMLDYYLIKPFKIFWAILFSNIKTFSVIRDAIPLIFLMFYINWSGQTLHVMPFIIIFSLGFISFFAIDIISTILVFFLGESTKLRAVLIKGMVSYDINKAPWNSLNIDNKKIILLILPNFIASALATNVLLGKTNLYTALTYALPIALLLLTILNIEWHFAIRHYSSASS